MPEHTPGPWTLEEDPTALHIYAEDGEVVHFSAGLWDEHQKKLFRANARLIAAAPDLFEVALDLASWSDPPYGLADLVDEARAAIAKARGSEWVE